MDRRPHPRRERIALAGLAVGSAAVGLFAVRAVTAWPLQPIAAARNGCLALAIGATTVAVWLTLQNGAALLRRMLARPRQLRVALGVTAMLLALGASEGALHVSAAMQPRTDVDVVSDTFVQRDPELGYRLLQDRDVDVRLVRTRDGQELGRVRYGLDGEGHRRTVMPQQQHDRAALFFGCSVTFGQGLDDADTVPSRYAAAMPRDLTINLAVPGYGPNHALVVARQPATLALPRLPQTPVAVFGWIDHHLERLCGSLHVRNLYGIDAPCFVLGADGHAQLLGPFRTAQPLRTAWLWAANKLELLRRCGYDWPGGVRSGDLELAAAVFDDLAAALQPAHTRLLLVQYPGSQQLARVVERLRDRTIAFANLGDLYDPHAEGMSIDRDGHPTARAAKILGENVAAAVRRAFP